MSAPGYTTDLTTLSQAEEAGSPPTGWAEPTATGWTTLFSPTAQETDFFIQNVQCISATVKTGVGGLLYDVGAAGITIPTDGAVLIWAYWAAANCLAAEASGGMRMVIGSALNAFYWVNAGGNDFAPNPYGGWMNLAMGDPGAISVQTVGSPGATRRYMGWCYNAPTAVPSKGNPYGVDALRYGRCEMRMTGGDAGGYGLFSGFAAQNDLLANRWGLFQSQGGSYLWKGLMAFGAAGSTTSSRARNTNVATIVTGSAHGLRTGDVVTITGLGGVGYNATASVTVTNSTTFTYSNTGGNEGTTGDTGGTVSPAVDFRDSNTVIQIANTKNVTANFNKIEIRRTTSRVDLTNVSFIALGTVSKGRFECIDDADVNIAGCTFNGMDTFIFKSLSEILSSTFLNCGVVTANSAKFNGSTFTGFTGAADTSQLVWDTNVNTNGKVDNCTFTKGTNATHAIQLGTNSPTSVTLTNCTFNGYNAANGQNDSTILVSRAAGNVTINVVNCTGNISYKSAGATVTIASNPVSATVTVTDNAVPPNVIANARVLVLAYSGGPMPYNVTVTLSLNGTTVTVAHTAHGMATNDKVQITGALLPCFNGVFSITKINDDSYSFQVTPVIQYVQSNKNANQSTSVACAFTKDVTKGALIVVAVAYNSSNVIGASPFSDNQGNSYTVDKKISTDLGTPQYVMAHAVAGSSGPLTVTFTTTTSVKQAIVIEEFWGSDGTVDVSASYSNASQQTAINSGSITTTYARCLLAAMATWYSAQTTATPDADYVELQEIESQTYATISALYRFVTSTLTDQADWTIGSLCYVGGIIVAFKAIGAVQGTTIKATYVALEGLTDAGGQITMSRSFTSSQPVTGRARQASSAPYRKTTDFTGTISSLAGLTLTTQLLPDV